MTTQNAIDWPEKYLPGTRDNFVSNEVIVQGLTAARVWSYLVDTSEWEGYYDNVADISFPNGGGPEERLDVLHAWLVEDLPGGRVRILTQETQLGEPAAALANERSNPMLDGHQAWLDGLVRAASK
ncbi:SRPBCC domain-containing protein [Streptomyces sp. NPDC002328]|uniref:SRPBCC domain-containing protein n=1 Tax=Streptomyces sp. NPDC002328 TaxID=3364642 RepID=UPI003698121E